MTTPFACVFPGQGSQTPGMLSELATHYDLVTQLFQQASDALGYDVWRITQDNPDNQLNQTQYTQPALLTAEVAVWQCWLYNDGPQPAVMAGHSLGEYSALVCAGAIDFIDAVKLVALRGELMQQAVTQDEGAMAAIIGLDDASVLKLCQQVVSAGEVLSPANYNSIGQTVIAGHATAVDRAVSEAKNAGAKLAKRIAVSVPSHCALMQPAAEQLEQAINDINISAPNIPVVHNYDVATHNDVAAIRAALIAQLTHPVRWVETMQKIMADGVTIALECGPGKVIAGLNKRIDKSLVTYPLNDSETLQSTLQTIRGTEVCL